MLLRVSSLFVVISILSANSSAGPDRGLVNAIINNDQEAIVEAEKRGAKFGQRHCIEYIRSAAQMGNMQALAALLRLCNNRVSKLSPFHIGQPRDRGGLLHLALWHGDFITTRTLLEAGINTNSTDGQGWTPLHIATYLGNLRLAQMLVLQYGANPNVPDNLGMQPIHLAAFYDRQAFIPLLLSRGANVDVQDHFDQTPLHLASLANNRDMLIMLLLYDAVTTINDANGRTPWDIAILNMATASPEQRLTESLIDLLSPSF